MRVVLVVVLALIAACGRKAALPPVADVAAGGAAADAVGAPAEASPTPAEVTPVVAAAPALDGPALWTKYCALCHGPEAKGTQALGAPNLTDKVWLYGSSENTIIETVTGGRQNRMPAWQEFLGDAKVHLLTAYVYSLSNSAK